MMQNRESQLIRFAKQFIKVLKYPASMGIVIFMLNEIGWRNMTDALRRGGIKAFLIPLLPVIMASVVRVWKLKILLKSKEDDQVLNLFLVSRFGNTINSIGYFLPVLIGKFNNLNTFNVLIVDKLNEVFITLVLGLIASLGFFIFVQQKIFGFLCIIFLVPSLVAFFLTYVGFSIPQPKNKGLAKICGLVAKYQNACRDINRSTLIILALTVIATLFDYLFIWSVFKTLQVSPNFLIIPVIWASGGLVGFIALLPVGPAEYSVVYLYQILAGIKPMDSAAMLVFVKIAVILNLLVFLIWRWIKAAIQAFRLPVPVNRNQDSE